MKDSNRSVAGGEMKVKLDSHKFAGFIRHRGNVCDENSIWDLISSTIYVQMVVHRDKYLL